jgi:hypothetical protein
MHHVSLIARLGRASHSPVQLRWAPHRPFGGTMPSCHQRVNAELFFYVIEHAQCRWREAVATGDRAWWCAFFRLESDRQD